MQSNPSIRLEIRILFMALNRIIRIVLHGKYSALTFLSLVLCSRVFSDKLFRKTRLHGE